MAAVDDGAAARRMRAGQALDHGDTFENGRPSAGHLDS
jgi:hypothetical protein